MNIDNIFVNILAHDELNVDNTNILDFCEKLPNNDSGRQVSNEGGYQSNIFDMSTTESLLELHKKITEQVNWLHDYMGFKTSLKKTVDQCWVNINPPGTHNSMHTHNGGVFTGIYYVKVPEHSGNLQMITPIAPFDFVMKGEYIDVPNQFNNSNILAQPKEKHLYIFPCWIAHQVQTNLSNETRISIAFDIAIS